MVGLVVAILVVGVVLADRGKYLLPNEYSPDYTHIFLESPISSLEHAAPGEDTRTLESLKHSIALEVTIGCNTYHASVFLT